MKLAEALTVLKKAPVDGAVVEIALACGFTPLHLSNYFAAHLQILMPNDRVQIATGLFGDLLGTVASFGSERPVTGAVVIEWADLDPRLGFRSLGGWGQKTIPSVLENVRAKLQHFEHHIQEVSSASRLVVCLPTLPLPPGFHTASAQSSEAELILHTSLSEFAKRIAAHPSVSVLSSQQLDLVSPLAGRYDFRADLHTGFPYSLVHAEALGRLLAQILRPAQPKKGLITDLDDTLWCGLVGEIGPDKVTWDLSNHTQIHGLYQQMLQSLADQGVLIAIASKNSAEIAEQALLRSDCLLSKESVFPLQIHWEPKSVSVSRILKTWNIGADSIVFVDDNPLELEEVRSAHADVECLLFPKSDPNAFLNFLIRLRDLFGKPRLSEEDSFRLASIRDSRVLEEAQSSGSRAEDLLASLDAEIHFDFHPSPADGRVLELINKTNQFNLNGRRISPTEWQERLSAEGAFVAAVQYKDKFGPLGKIAVVQGREDANRLRIESWVMSCRAFSRRIEHQTLTQLFEHFAADEVVLDFAGTPKNKPTEDFLTELLDEKPGSGTTIARRQFSAKCPKLYHKVTKQ